MASLKQSAEDMYGTMIKHGNTYDCNTVLVNVNSSIPSEKDILQVIKY